MPHRCCYTGRLKNCRLRLSGDTSLGPPRHATSGAREASVTHLLVPPTSHAFRLARSGAPVVVVNPTLPVGPGDWGRSPPTQMIAVMPNPITDSALVFTCSLLSR